MFVLKEPVLMMLALDAHRLAAWNDNASSLAFRVASMSSGDFLHGVVAALMTLGKRHAPVEEARHMIYVAGQEEMRELVESGEKVPGWGNSFYKDSIDPAFSEVDAWIRKEQPDHAKILDEKTEMVRELTEKDLYPNAASYTAICAEILGLPAGLAVLLFVQGRLGSWAQMFEGGS